MRASPLLGLVLAILLLLAVPAVVLAGPGADAPAGAPAGLVDAESVGAFVDGLRAEAARIRGLEWKRPVPAFLLSRDELRTKMEAMAEEDMDPEELARDTRILRRLGLLGPDEDPLALVLGAMQNMVGGFYDPDEEQLYLIDGMTGEAQKPVIVHELVHALEDQHLDLRKRMEQFEEDGDRFFAEKCLGEGSAEHARVLYEKDHPEISELYQKEQGDPEQTRRQIEAMQKVPAYLFLPTMLHYSLGPRLVSRAVGDDFPQGIQALYEDPPVSQEQFLHPQKWFSAQKDFPQRVKWAANFAEVAGEGWAELHDLPSGELDLAMYLDYFLGYTKGKVNLFLLQQGKHVVPQAKKAAAGWDASQTVYIEKEGEPIVVIEALAFDTPADATEAMDALYQVFQKANGDTFVEKSREESVEGDEIMTRRFDFAGRHGLGRLHQRGAELLVLDGGSPEIFERLWGALEETTFEKDPRDTWDPAAVPDAFATCDYVDRDRGLGARLPSEAWQAAAGRGQPGLAVTFQKGAVQAALIVAPAPLDAVWPKLEELLASSVPGGKLPEPEDREIAGTKGRVYVLPAATVPGPGGTPVEVPGRRIYVAEVEGKSLLLRVDGPAQALADSVEEIDGLAKGLVLVTD